MTLQAMADESGLSKSFISQIESGDANPSIASLRKIAGSLAMPLAALFQVEQKNGDFGANGDRIEKPQSPVSVVRKDRRKMLVWPGQNAKTYLLTPDLQRELEVTLSEMEPGADTGSDTYSHNGEECGFVLEGSLEVTICGQVYMLEAGDAIAFPSHLPHRQRVLGENTARTIWVNTPPSY